MQEEKEKKIEPLRQFHLEFLETLASIWPLTYKRKQLFDEGDLKGMEAVDEEQKPIIEHANDLLKQMILMRMIYAKAYRKNEDFRKKEDEWCKTDFVHWINWWVWTEDPRLPPLGLPGRVPMVLWPAQEKILTDFDYCYKSRISALLEKSRETGASWMFICYITHHFLFHKGFKATIASRMEKLVDEWDNPDCLFSKVRYILYTLPLEMRPTGFEKKGGAFDNKMRIVNADMQSSIIGESGDNIGRGGRSSMTMIDEAAFLEHPELVDSALLANTNCQLDLSTPNGMNSFYRKRMGGGVKVLTLKWHNDPSKNVEWKNEKKPEWNAWYEYQKARYAHDPSAVAREIDIDYNASVEGVFIPPDWVRAAVDFDLNPEGERVAGFDVAGGGKNESVYILRVGPVAYLPQVIHYDTPTEATWDVVDRGEDDNISLLNYDLDGIGISVFGTIKASERKLKFRINGIRGNARASEDMIETEGKQGNEKYMNKRAECWDNLRQRFRKTYEHRNKIKFYSQDELISIPDDPVLITQLSSPKEKKTNTGKLGVESKVDMRSRGVSSPDKADALVYCFTDYDVGSHVVDKFDYTDQKGQYCEFEIDYRRPAMMQFVSVVQLQDMSTSGIVATWWPSNKKPLLQIYEEFSEHNAQPKDVVGFVNEYAFPHMKPIKEWIGNEEMFTGKEDGLMKPWYLYRKEKVTLKRNYTDDYRGAIMLVNQMFAAGMIQIHSRCETLMLQLMNWTKKGGKPDANLGIVMALCQLVTRLKKKKMINKKLIVKPEYNGAGRFAMRSEDDHTVKNIVNFINSSRSRGNEY